MITITKRLAGSAVLVMLIGGGGDLLLGGHGAAQAGAAQVKTAARAHPYRLLLKALRLRAQVLTVTSLNGTSISTTTRDGGALTVTTSGATTYSEAGSAVTLSAVQPNDHILVQGSRDRAAHTVQATKITIVVSSVTGVVTAVSGSTITITGVNAVQRSFTIGNARIEQAGQAVALQDIAVGSSIIVQGTPGTGSAFTVLRVVIRLPQVAGTVASVNGASFTVRTAAARSYTISPAPSATYVVWQQGKASAATATEPTLTVGERVRAVGSLSADGTTLTAQRVVVRPAAKVKAAATATPASGV